MAPRWVKTKERVPAMCRPHETSDDDWLLLSGQWTVGRVHRDGGAHNDQFAWSLTGPHTPDAPGRKRGTVPTLKGAKQGLLTAWRAWQRWAGVRDAD